MSAKGRFLPTALAVVVFSLFAGHASQVAAGGNGYGDDDDDDDDGCSKVKGKFVAQNVPPGDCASPVGFCTEGTLSGKLKGTYAFTMNAAIPSGDPDVPSVNFFSGTSVITTSEGTVLTAVDTGAINLAPPGTLNSGRLSTLLTITEGGAGHLWIHGTADLANGTVQGRFRGEICMDEDD